MSHEDLDDIDELDDEDFVDEVGTLLVDEPEKIVVSQKVQRGIRRRIEDVLEERQLRAALKAYDDHFQSADIILEGISLD